MVFLLVNLSKMRIELTDESLGFGFGFWKKRFRLSDVESCQPAELRFCTYLGIGVRWGRDGTIAYSTRFGKGVRLSIKGSGRDYVISTDNPERICGILANLR